jgi:hypothetical protein
MGRRLDQTFRACERLGQEFCEEFFREKEVDEPWSGDLDFVKYDDSIDDRFVLLKRDGISKGSRRKAAPLGSNHRKVGHEVAVRGDFGPIHLDGDLQCFFWELVSLTELLDALKQKLTQKRPEHRPEVYLFLRKEPGRSDFVRSRDEFEQKEGAQLEQKSAIIKAVLMNGLQGWGAVSGSSCSTEDVEENEKDDVTWRMDGLGCLSQISKHRRFVPAELRHIGAA